MICRSCGSSRFGKVIDLGLMPLVNNLMQSPDEVAPRWPLHVVFCRDCSLAQLTQTPPPGAMFDKYVYFSSQSETMLAHARQLVDRFVDQRDRVLEIASNDGYLLQFAKAKGADALGVDPARNVVAYANSHGVPTRCAYFNRATAETLLDEWGEADVIFANNVLAHVPDPNEIAAGIAVMLAREGRAHIEVPWIVSMLDSGAFDTIYHEHHSYFSLHALQALFRRHDLTIVDARPIPIHGGSLHVQVARAGSDAQVIPHLTFEAAVGVFEDRCYTDFAARVEQTRIDLEKAMNPFKTIVGYGAAAKGIVLLNALGLDRSRIPWVADVSPHKQGRFVPGTGQEIVSPSRLLDEKPAAALLLPWNIRDEVLRRNQAFRDQGGRFIVPIPEVTIV